MIVDISQELEADEMPLCPLCEQPIFYGDEIAIAKCQGVMALAHIHCCDLPGAIEQGEIQ